MVGDFKLYPLSQVEHSLGALEEHFEQFSIWDKEQVLEARFLFGLGNIWRVAWAIRRRSNRVSIDDLGDGWFI